jgi:hypothetical protein
VKVVLKEDCVVVKMEELIDRLDARVEMESIGEGMMVVRDHDLVVDLDEDVLQSRLACTECTHRILR